jgi:prepilin-type N-terminal cleavage/methylation domain-containing protein/prepilin-type processing-associated H-X9-DG protein
MAMVPCVRRAFTLVEMLVAIVVVALLVAIALPALGAARTRARTLLCATRLQQLGVATNLYLNDFNGALPQTRNASPLGGDDITGMLFGGKKGTLPLYGYDMIGAERRPLNPYVRTQGIPRDADRRPFELEPFHSPMDKGADQTYLPLASFQSADSIYDLLGTSYVLNDHGLNGEMEKTLIPAGGGPIPFVLDPTRTWMLGSHTIYNFQQDSDRGEYWYSPRRAEANLFFVDGHARMVVPIPDVQCEVENTTPDYTFLPTPAPGH